MDTFPWDKIQRELNSAILMKFLADLEKSYWFLETEELKDECIFMFSGNSLNDKPN